MKAKVPSNTAGRGHGSTHITFKYYRDLVKIVTGINRIIFFFSTQGNNTAISIKTRHSSMKFEVSATIYICVCVCEKKRKETI
jgi:hypothetical protein